jgi:hypothetical protein
VRFKVPKHNPWQGAEDVALALLPAFFKGGGLSEFFFGGGGLCECPRDFQGACRGLGLHQ